MGSQQFCLRWNNHQSNMLAVFDQLLQSEAFVDVTLACEGLSLKAHKMVLSACSPYFQSLFMDNPCQHPIVILKDMHYNELKAIVDFMYKGEVNVSQEQLSTLLKTAEALKVKGLAEVTGAANGVQEEGSHTNDMPTLRHLLPNNQLSSIPLESRVPPAPTVSVQQQQPIHQDGRISPQSKRKRGRPRKRSNSDGGHDSMEVLESLVDIPEDETMSPLPTPQAKDSQSEERDEDRQSPIISDDRSTHDEQEGAQDDMATCDIKMEVLTPESLLLPLCLEEPNQSILSNPSSTPATSQDKQRRTRKKNWSEMEMYIAVTAIKFGHMSINMAARAYNIPAMTLWKRAQSLGVASTFPRRGGRKSPTISGRRIPTSLKPAVALANNLGVP